MSITLNDKKGTCKTDSYNLLLTFLLVTVMLFIFHYMKSIHKKYMKTKRHFTILINITNLVYIHHTMNLAR